MNCASCRQPCYPYSPCGSCGSIAHCLLAFKGQFPGNNPFGYVPRPAKPVEIGVGYSGEAHEVRAADVDGVQVLNINLGEFVPNGYHGEATIHVFVDDVTPNPLAGELDSNAKLLADIRWQSGIGGGEQTIDITRGGHFSVGGTVVVGMTVRLVSAVLDEPVVEWATKKVQVTVNWQTSPSKDPLDSGPEVALVADTPSPWFPIPLQAHTMLAQGFPSTAFPTLLAEFSSNNVGGGSIRFDTLNPNANGTFIVAGVEFYRFTNSAPMGGVLAVFELW